jgi:hypothetical protein
MSVLKKQFNKKSRYIVKKDLDTVLDNFKKGEILVFEKMSYSYYDSATIYTFSIAEKSDYVQAFISDNDNIEISEYFE